MRLLVALDFSDCSRAACRWALYLAHQLDAGEVIFLHVLPACGTDEASTAPRLAELEQGVAQIRQVVADEAAAVLDGKPLPDGRVSYSTVRGDPDAAILDAATDNRVDAVVVGTHGRTGLSRVVLGSVAESVVRRSTCTVITVKGGHPGSR